MSLCLLFRAIKRNGHPLAALPCPRQQARGPFYCARMLATHPTSHGLSFARSARYPYINRLTFSVSQFPDSLLGYGHNLAILIPREDFQDVEWGFGIVGYRLPH